MDEEQLKLAEAKFTETKAAKEKQLAELTAKVTEAENVRKQVDKENTELWNTIQKLARERDQLKLASLTATGTADRAAMDTATRKRTVQSAETQVAQQTERKQAAEKQLADAKAVIEKRARAQFK